MARRCGGGGLDDCEDGRSLDFSMDFFDRGPPPPHYMTWWKPPSSYFPREAPPPYEEAIASTSNVLPATFTAIYNNNNVVIIPPPTSEVGIGDNSSSTVADGQALPNQASTTFPTHTEDCNGVEISTTILSTPQPADPQSALNSVPGSSSAVPNTSEGVSSGCRRLFSKPKRFHSVGNNSSRTSRSETEHLRRARGTGQHRSTSGLNHPVVGIPLGSSSSSSTSASGSLLPLSYPPPYDYGEELLRYHHQHYGHGHDGRNSYQLRQSLTLPRQRTEYFGGRPGTLAAALPQLSQGQVDRTQQRFSLQLHGRDGVGGTAGWSSASSSTLSLSTPNSPNDVIGVGRPPSLSSSSSSNVSGANVQM